jgi:MFS family permease
MKLSAPLRRPAFRRLAISFTVNELGDWLGVIALAVLVFDETGSALATTGLFLGTRFLPALVAPPLVARTDRTPPRYILPVIYCGEAGAFAALALLADSFSLALVIVLATIDGTLALCGRSLTRAVVAALLEPTGELRSGNAILNIGFTGGAAVGPAVAGVTVAGLGVQAALLLDALSFYLIALLMLTGPLPRPQPEIGGWPERLRAGLSYIGRRPVLRRLMTAQGAAFVFFAAVIPIEVIYAKGTLGAGDSGYGAMLASWGFGMLLGGLLFAALREMQLSRLLVVSTLAVGAAYLGLAAAPSLLAACGASVVGGCGNGVQWVAMVSAVQEMTSERMQARVMSVLESVGAAMPGVGYLLGGLVATALDPRATFLVAGIGVLAVVALAIPFLARTSWVKDEETTESPDAEGDGSAKMELRLQGASPER